MQALDIVDGRTHQILQAQRIDEQGDVVGHDRQIVLAAHPEGPIAEQHFALRESRLPRAGEGQFVLRNLILSMDAGFRQWMNAGAGDDYLPGMQLGDPVQAIVIGRVIESYARRFDYGVVRDFTGHGIGTAFHSGLVVPHYDDPRFDTVLEVGMTFTIEPMLTLGTFDYDIWPDGWTVVTKDRRLSAQFEHTIVVTPTGSEILTLP